MKAKTKKSTAKKVKFGNKVLSTKLLVFIAIFAVVGAYLLTRSFAAATSVLTSLNLDTANSVGAALIKETNSSSKRNNQVVQLSNASGATNAKAVLRNIDAKLDTGVYKVCLHAFVPSGTVAGGIQITTYSNGKPGTVLGQTIYSLVQTADYVNTACFSFTNNNANAVVAAVVTNATANGLMRIGNVSLNRTGGLPAPAPSPTPTPTPSPGDSKPLGYGSTNGPSGTWNLKWSDEFNGSSLDLTKWRPNWVGGNDTAITKPSNGSMLNCEDPAQVKVSGGKLGLTLVQRSCKDNSGKSYSYASGLVDTHADYTFDYGYVETYMNMPPATGSTACANWPGIWTNGQQSGGVEWPVFLESDIMECLGGEAKANVHAGPSKGDDAWKKTIGGIGQKSGWHTFGASLDRGTKSCSGSTPNAGILTYYYDGVRIGSPYEVCFKNTGQFVILQNDIQSNSKKNTLPSTVEFEYVRVWQR